MCGIAGFRLPSAGHPREPLGLGNRELLGRRAQPRIELEMDVGVGHARDVVDDLGLDAGRDQFRLADLVISRELEVQRDLMAAFDGEQPHVMDLAYTGHRLRGGPDALVDGAVAGFDVHDGVHVRKYRLQRGLDGMDKRYLNTIAMKFGGGPVGIETISAALAEPRDAVEDIIEPYLIQQGFIQRTPRGRILTPHAFRHLGLAIPPGNAAQMGLFPDADDT